MAGKKQGAKAPKQHTRDELESMSKEELQSLAEKRGVTVTRTDGEDGEPLKDDYVGALSGNAGNVGHAGSAGIAAGQQGDDADLDETVPGGHYIKADGTHVNANGQPLDTSGNVIEQGEE